MKLLRSSPHSRQFCLPLACLLALSACAPGTVGTDAEPAPIEVPPPVEQTNEGLSIFYTDAVSIRATILDMAVGQYNREHPDNPVTAEKVFTDSSDTVSDEQTQQMLAEVMAGEGPDLIFFVDDTMDIEKMARRGVFADLEPYFEADNFDWSGYNQTVMDAGVWDGHRLVIPLEYKIPMLYTSQTALEDTGFSVENCDTFDGFLTEAEKVQNDSAQTRRLFRTIMAFKDFAQYAGIPYVDYGTQKADLSFPELERGATIYKNLTELSADGDSMSGAADIRDGTALWICPLYSPDGFLTGPGFINTFDELVMMPIRDVEGGIQAKITFSVAVRNSSPNLQNAYEFIKFLLSEDFQLATNDYRWRDFSVLNATNEDYYTRNTTERATGIVNPSNPYGFTEFDLPQEDFDELMSYTEQITGTFYTSSQTQFIDLMQGYLDDEISYKDAVKAAESQLNIYLSE